MTSGSRLEQFRVNWIVCPLPHPGTPTLMSIDSKCRFLYFFFIWQKVPVNKLEKELILRNGFFPVSINTELAINVMYRCQFLCNFLNIFKIILINVLGLTKLTYTCSKNDWVNAHVLFLHVSSMWVVDKV